MDPLEERHIHTKRGFDYRYYISPASQADSSKPVILLCHGWPDSSKLWKHVVAHLLKTRNRLVVPDLLGYGGSSKPTEPKDFEIKAMVTDIMEIFDAEQITSPIIPVGHDWGSYFAQRVYLLNIPRMAGLVTLNVAFMPPRPAFDLDEVNKQTEKLFGYPLFAYWELFTHPDGPKLMDEHVESVWYAIHGADDDWMKKLFCERGTFEDWLSNDRKDSALKPFAQDQTLKDEWIADMKAGGFTAPNCWYRATKENFNSDTEKTLPTPKVEKPYLFIGCDGDPVCRTDLIEPPKLAGLLPDLEVTELHSGHWCPLERPQEVAIAISEWLVKKGFA